MSLTLDDILSGVNYVGETLDKPGRAARGLLTGNFGELLNLIPFSDKMGLTDPSKAVSGRDMLQHYGAVGEDDGELGWDDAAGMGMEMIFDPTNLIPGVGALRAAKLGKRVAGANKNVAKQLAMGFMPPDVAKKTKMVDTTWAPKPGMEDRLAEMIRKSYVDDGLQHEDEVFAEYARRKPNAELLGHVRDLPGTIDDEALIHYPWARDALDLMEQKTAPSRYYHGTTAVYDKPDEKFFDPGSLFTGGHYGTKDPRVAGTYTYTEDDHVPEWVLKPGVKQDAVAADLRGLHGDDFGSDEKLQGDMLDLYNTISRYEPGGELFGSKFYDSVRQSVDSYFDDAAMPIPNTRMHYLDLRNPFDGDYGTLPFSAFEDEARERVSHNLDRNLRTNERQLKEIDTSMAGAPLISNLSDYNLGGDAEWTQTVREGLLANIEQLRWKQDMLADNTPLSSQQWQGDFNLSPQNIGAAAKQLGHDGVYHVGGGRAGGGRKMHDVGIAFDPSSVYLPYIADELQQPPAMTPLAYAASAAIYNPLMQMLRDYDQ